MEMKKILRSGLALLCCASLVLGSLGMIIPAVQAAESLPTDFNEVAPVDFGIADFSGNTEKASHTSSLKPLQSADKMLFQTKVIFGGGKLQLLDKDTSTSAIEGINFWKNGDSAIRFNCSYAKIHVGGYYEGGTYKGGQIGFNAAGTEPYIYDMYPTLPSGTTSATAEFSMAITTEVVNFNEGTTANDLKLGVWFDGKLYNDTYFYLCDYIFTQDNILMIASVESITSPAKPQTLPTDFNEVTPEDFGIANFSGNTEKASHTSSLKPLQSADKMLFQTKVIFGGGTLQLLDKDTSTAAIEGLNFWKSGTSAIRFNCSYAKIYVGGYYEDGTYKDGQIGFNAAGTEPYIYDMYPTLPEGKTSATAEFSMAITTEVVNFNEGTTANDLKLGVWFDGKLYNDTYFYLCDYIFTQDNILMTASVESITSPEKPQAPYSDLTPAMMGVADAVDETTEQEGLDLRTPAGEEKLYELDRVKFSANVHFQGSSLSYFTYLFNEAGHGQISFMVNPNASSSLLVYNYRNTGADTNLYFGDKIAPGVDIETAYTKLKKNDDSSFGRVLGSSAGYGFIGINAPISITTEFVDFDNDGQKDDLEIGIFVNGSSTAAKYGYYKDYEETIFKGIVATYKVKAISSPTVTNPATPYTPPVETVYGELTPAVLGVPNTTDATNGVTLKTEDEDVQLYNLDKTKFIANVQYQATEMSHFTYLYNEAGRGQLTFIVNPNASSSLLLSNYKTTGDTTLYFGPKIAAGVDIATDYKEIATGGSSLGYILGSSKGCNFIGKNATISITTEFVDFDGDGTKDDLEIAIVVAGYEDKPYYAYYKNYEETTFKGILSTDNLVSVFSPEITNQAVPVTPSVEPPADPAAPPTFPEITFSDFGDMENGVYGHKGLDLAASGINPEGFANKTFVGTVKFSEQQSTRIDFAGKASPWYGIHLLTRNGNKLYLQEAENYFPAVLIEETNDFTWKNKEVQIRLVFELADLDVDGEEDDLRLWLYLNGNLYKNKPVVKSIDYAERLGNYLGIYSDNDASTVEITSAIIDRPKEEIDFAMMGFTKDWAKTLAGGSNVANSGSVSNQAPHTGDSATASIYVMTCILALIICGGVFYNKKQSKREND